jgi:hypothetical protein
MIVKSGMAERMGHQPAHWEHDQRPRHLRNKHHRHQESDRVLPKRNETKQKERSRGGGQA